MTRKTIPIKIAQIALKSMLYEVNINPKPGLVDSLNNGAHEDMDVFTFIDSSVSLYPYMLKCSQLGFSFKGVDPRDLFYLLRELGKEAEKDMLDATNGVNTQKGLIFILGIISACTAKELSDLKEFSVEEICNMSSIMVRGIVDKELVSLDKTKDTNLTAGQKMYLDYGITGIRGQAENGFPLVSKYALPNLYKNLAKGLSLNEALINTLLYIMTHAEDTNILWRGGMEALEIMRKSAREALSLGGVGRLEGKSYIIDMNKEFVRRNMSPGGSADLLAATIMFYLLDIEFNVKSGING